MSSQLPFPSSDAELHIYFQNAVAYLTTNASRLGITNTTLAHFTAVLNEWNVVYPKCANKDLQTKTFTELKNKWRTELMRALRHSYKDIPQSIYTPEDRAALNLPVRKGYRSAPPVPNSMPAGYLNINNRLEHRIHFYNSGGSKAKPYLVRGCQIWYKIGEPAVDVSELRYLITAPKSVYIHQLEGQHAGKMVHYWLRWENTKGETGPWSNVISGTVGG
jgi:hypothetical protein